MLSLLWHPICYSVELKEILYKYKDCEAGTILSEKFPHRTSIMVNIIQIQSFYVFHYSTLKYLSVSFGQS